MAQAKSDEQRLCDAIRAKNMDDIREVLMEDVDLNKLGEYSPKSKSKIAPLHLAVQSKKIAIVKLLVKFHADVNLQAFPSGRAAIHIASMYALPEIITFLLDNGADATINDNDGKNPLQMIGSKLKDDSDMLVVGNKADCQIILLEASAVRATAFKKSIEDDIADTETGLAGLKMESNQKIKSVERAQGRKFDQTHPYLCCAKSRYKVWSTKNKCNINDYLAKRYVKVNVPMYNDKDLTHFDFSGVQSFQIAMARELLLAAGLSLKPEKKPVGPKKKKKT